VENSRVQGYRIGDHGRRGNRGVRRVAVRDSLGRRMAERTPVRNEKRKRGDFYDVTGGPLSYRREGARTRERRPNRGSHF